MLRFWIILFFCLTAVLGRRIGRGDTWNIEPSLEDFNRDPVVAAEGKVLQKIKSDIYKLEKEEAEVEMDIMNRLKHGNQREKHRHHLGGIDDEDQYYGEGSGRRLYYAM